jgi:DNA-binding transcriptional MocR family regulator
LTLSLQTLTRPGDIVATGHPTFYGAHSAVERLHLKIVEIPVDPHEGSISTYWLTRLGDIPSASAGS